MKTKVIFALLIPAIACSISTKAAEGDVCGRIIDHGLNNIALATNSESYTDRLYWRFCDEKYENLSDSKKAEFGVTIKSIPFNLGAESSSASQKHSKFCGDYKSFTERNSDSAVYTSKLHDKAIDAWNNCVALTRSNLIIDFQVPQNQKYADVAMKYTGLSPATFSGVEASGFTCKRSGNDVGPATTFPLGTAEEHLRCERSASTQSVQGVTSEYYPAGGITVKTNAGNQAIEFVPMVEGPARSRFEQIDVGIAGVRQSVTNLSRNLSDWGNGDVSRGNKVGGGDAREAAMCPKGQYLVGIEWWGAPGGIKYCIGCLMGVQAICRPLNQSQELAAKQ